MSTTDSRQLLNLVLRHFYERGGTIYLLTDAHNGLIRISRHDANAAYATLLRDGHIEQVTPPENFPAFPIASITGQGRIFHEQGGYRDTTTYLDRLLDQAKNRPVLVWGFLILSGLSLISWVLDLVGLIRN